MNPQLIHQWLHQYTPIENEFKTYFEANHHAMDEPQFFDVLLKFHGLKASENAVLQNLDASNICTSQAMDVHIDFSDTLWLKPNDDFSIRKHPRYFPEFQHAHTFVELTYVYEGTCKQTFYYPPKPLTSTPENVPAKKITMSCGSLCLIPPGLSHTISVFDDSIIINLLIRQACIPQIFSHLSGINHELSDFLIQTALDNQQKNVLQFETGDDEALHRLIIDMMLEICENKPYAQKAIQLMLGLFFTYVQRDYTSTLHLTHEPASSQIMYIPNILAYMEDHISSVTIQELSEHFFLSKSYLCRLFKKYTGTTPIEALRKMRVQKAKLFLTDTQLPVSQICGLIGYSDETFFIRTFKQSTGYTPAQYRRLCLGK